MDGDGFEAGSGRDGCYGAGVVGLHAADGDEVGAGLGEGVGDEVFEFADFVAAVGEAAGKNGLARRRSILVGEFGFQSPVAIISLCPYFHVSVR